MNFFKAHFNQIMLAVFVFICALLVLVNILFLYVPVYKGTYKYSGDKEDVLSEITFYDNTYEAGKGGGKKYGFYSVYDRDSSIDANSRFVVLTDNPVNSTNYSGSGTVFICNSVFSLTAYTGNNKPAPTYICGQAIAVQILLLVLLAGSITASIVFYKRTHV